VHSGDRTADVHVTSGDAGVDVESAQAEGVALAVPRDVLARSNVDLPDVACRGLRVAVVSVARTVSVVRMNGVGL
jgi:hypothetical protein